MALSRSNVPITQKDDSTSSSQKEVIELVRDDPSEVKEESSRADFIGLGPFKTAVGGVSLRKGISSTIQIIGVSRRRRGVRIGYIAARKVMSKRKFYFAGHELRTGNVCRTIRKGEHIRYSSCL